MQKDENAGGTKKESISKKRRRKGWHHQLILLEGSRLYGQKLFLRKSWSTRTDGFTSPRERRAMTWVNQAAGSLGRDLSCAHRKGEKDVYRIQKISQQGKKSGSRQMEWGEKSKITRCRARVRTAKGGNQMKEIVMKRVIAWLSRRMCIILLF